MRCRFPIALLALVALPCQLAGQNPSAALLARIDSVVNAQLTQSGAPAASVAVSRGGELLMARGFGYQNLETGTLASAETIFRIGSITKQFTAALIMQLVEQGRIGLDDELTKYLPDYPTQGNRVTIRHLLTHTSGIKSYTGLGPKFWAESSRLDLSDEQMLALFKDQPFDFKPGERYLYNNSAFYLLGMIAAKVSGTPYPDLLKQRLLDPLGLASTSYCDDRAILPHRASGYEVRLGKPYNSVPLSLNVPGAAGAMCSTVLDLLAWQRALNAGKAVTAASLTQMRTPATLNDGKATSYGFGLGIGSLEGHRSVSHSGGINGFASWLGYFPDDDVTVAVLTNSGSGPAVRIGNLVARLTLGIPLPVLRDLAVTPAARAQVVGTYDLGGARVVIQDGPDGLTAQLPGEPPTRLLFQGQGEYRIRSNPEAVIRFETTDGTAHIVAIVDGSRLVGARLR